MGTFIYDTVACRELVLVSQADGSQVTALMPDATEPVPQDAATIAALSRKLSRMLGKGKLLMGLQTPQCTFGNVGLILLMDGQLWHIQPLSSMSAFWLACRLANRRKHSQILP